MEVNCTEPSLQLVFPALLRSFQRKNTLAYSARSISDKERRFYEFETCPLVLPSSLNSASLMAASFCDVMIFGGEKSSSSMSILEWPFFGVLGDEELKVKTPCEISEVVVLSV
jgi:hypothetical protein